MRRARPHGRVFSPFARDVFLTLAFAALGLAMVAAGLTGAPTP